MEVASYSDNRGVLTVLNGELPFEISRLFWLSAPSGSTRGEHGHYRNEMLIVLIQGSIEITCIKDGVKNNFLLECSGDNHYVAVGEWHSIFFNKSSIVLALNSMPYDKEDYFYEPSGPL